PLMLTRRGVRGGRNPEIQAAYGVLSMPTLMVFRDGRPVKSVVGVRAKARLLRELEDVI
ncbi:thioredoxin family protein, partial [Kitasatospora sp. NPDC096147]|uniref:thioredoxin family protein n=1 Tax=Kitasatospora sp. NPDC096147 TaxID=3364093 RepID=UPI00380B473B